MSDLPALLKASLSPDTRKGAEQQLSSRSTQPNFLPNLLRLILDTSHDRAVRLSAGIYLKNTTRSRWEEDVNPLPEQDKSRLRSELIPAMLSLSSVSDKSLRAQVAESISLIAELDFPAKWPEVIDQLVASLSPTDYTVNIGVLETAHSIFRPWRAHVRSDKLYSEINLVFKSFMNPFLQLFRQTVAILLSYSSVTQPNYEVIARCQVLLLDIYFDFTCQDLPPDIEDSHHEFFEPSNGWFQRLLACDPEGSYSDTNDAQSLISQIKTRVFEIAELFVKMYPEQLQKSPCVEAFVRAVWELMGSGKHMGWADDALVSQALRFLSTSIRTGYYKEIFGVRETISALVQGVVVPNVRLRDRDLEQFEDDPMEFIRLDLSLPSGGVGSSEVATRRQAAGDVLQALVSSGLDAETTEIAGTWISGGLQEYHANPEQNWKSKNSAVYLLAAIASRGSTSMHGVTATNSLVDVIRFFSEHVFQDLQAASRSVHPILQVDAIRFLQTFRNQLTKPQLLSVLPLLVQHAGSDNFVIYTYAAIAIERILFIKRDGRLIFAPDDVENTAPNLIKVLLAKIEASGSPEKVAENDHLMKCVMRVIMTARHTLMSEYGFILQRLVHILGIICTNPSNPNFDQFTFESISALIRFMVKASPATLNSFEHILFGPISIVLQQDIDQYIPYAFQILAQMLELHSDGVPADYHNLLPFLLAPAIWQQKGCIPGLVKLIKAFLAKDSKRMISAGQISSVLAIVQQRLIPSKLNDAWGFELLQAVTLHVPIAELDRYMKVMFMTVLTRMQTSKTDKFVYLFTYYLTFAMAVNAPGLSPDYLIGVVESIQPGLWSQIFANIVIPQLPKMLPKDCKVVVVGLTKLLTESKLILRGANVQLWPTAFNELIKLFLEPQHLAAKTGDDDANAGYTEIDYEEQTAGYQAAFSKLASSEGAPTDYVSYVGSVRAFVGQALANMTRAEPQTKALLLAGDAGVVRPFLQMVGYDI